MNTSYYKLTAVNGSSCYGGSGHWRLNRWRSVRGPLAGCRNGLHLCRVGDLSRWVAVGLIWRVEVEGEVLVCENKVVARRARPVERIGLVTVALLAGWAADCATRAPGSLRAADLLDAYAAAAYADAAVAVAAAAAVVVAAAADAAARANAYDEERAWQGEHLLALVRGEP